MLEEWKPIEGYPDYEVSNLGRVRSWAPLSWNAKPPSEPRIRTLWICKSGYPSLNLYNKEGRRNHLVHILVAAAFIGPRPHGMDVCHNDGNPANCVVSNLRYDTRSGNMADTAIHGTRSIGESRPKAKLTEDIVKHCRSMYVPRDPDYGATALAKRYGVAQTVMSKAVTGKTWTHI